MKRAMCEPDYPLEYLGEGLDGLIHGDYVKVVRELPHGSTAGRYTFVGDWAEVEEYFEARHYFVPRRTLKERTV